MKKKRQPKRLLSPHYEIVKSRKSNGKCDVLTPEGGTPGRFNMYYKKKTKKL